jgi:antitoxin (DNA-binding transcriptional repressor) of toxin-antitoxin stability system
VVARWCGRESEIEEIVSAIGVRELAEHTRDVLQRVRETGEIIDIADEGRVLARRTREPPPVDAATRRAILKRRHEHGEDIGKSWPESVSAADAIADVRRDLRSFSMRVSG